MNFIRRNVVGNVRKLVPTPAPKPQFTSPHIVEAIRKNREREATDRQAIHVPQRPLPVRNASSKTKIAIVYIFPSWAESKYWRYAVRFLFTYMSNPPLEDHATVIVMNGSKVSDDIRRMFAIMPNVRFIEHDNTGWDIGAFQRAAREVPADMMLFLSASTYFRGPGWLKRMREATEKHGPALYGCMGNRGDAYVKVEPHIRTTGWWINPALLNEFPYVVKHKAQRYEFEHGKTCLTGWITNVKKLNAWVVTWHGEYLWENWDVVNGMHSNEQSELMLGDRLTEPPFFPKVALT